MSERQVLINFIASLSLADHLGDAYDNAIQALKQIGIVVDDDFLMDHPEGGLDAIGEWLARHHDAQTVWGTSLLDDDDD
tara:strand:+ start:12229 stop:12465 length:237 start_codon:yes stop_codon:yes gene_type:complete